MHGPCHASCSYPWTHKPYHPPAVMTRMLTQSVIPNVQSKEPCQKHEMGRTYEVTKPRQVRTCVPPSNSAHFPSCSQRLGKYGRGHHVSASISTAQERVSDCNLAPASIWAAYVGRTRKPMTHCCGQARQAKSRITTYRRSSWSGGVGAHPLRDRQQVNPSATSVVAYQGSWLPSRAPMQFPERRGTQGCSSSSCVQA